jgi:hypothetical protein
VSDLLSEQEIRDLTKKQAHPAQERELAKLGIRAKPRSDGSLIVLRAHRDAVLGLRDDSQHRPKKNEINWGPDVAASPQP